MISKNAASLASLIVKNNPWIDINASNLTPIGELNNLSLHPFADQLEVPEGENREVFELVKASSTQLQGMALTHDVRQTEVAKMFSQTLFERLTVLRETVIPAVETIASKVQMSIQERFPTMLEIKTLPVSDVYYSRLISEFLKNYPAELVRDATTLNGLSDRDETEIAKLLNTGVTSLNQFIVDVIASHPTNWLEEIYQRYFQAGDRMKINTRFDPVSGYSLLDEMLIVHVLARSIQANNVVDAGINMSLNEYNLALANLIVATGSTLNRCIQRLTLAKQAGVVVAFVDRNSGITYVYGDAYDQYLQQGGLPEAVLGAIEAGQTSAVVSELLSNQATFKTAAEDLYQKQLRVIEMDYFPSISRSITPIAIEYFGSLPAEKQALFVVPRNGNFAKAGDVLTASNVGELAVALGALVSQAGVGKDIRKIVRWLVVDCCMPHLGFAKTLSHMESLDEEAKQRGVALGQREAAYYAVIQELVNAFVDNCCSSGDIQPEV